MPTVVNKRCKTRLIKTRCLKPRLGSWLMESLESLLSSETVSPSQVFTRKRFQRKKLHYLLINLAITDLTVGLISVPLMMTVFLSELYNFQIPKSLDDVHYFFDVLSGLTSMYSIAFIAVERLLVVCWPFKQNLLRLWHYAL